MNPLDAEICISKRIAKHVENLYIPELQPKSFLSDMLLHIDGSLSPTRTTEIIFSPGQIT